MTTYMCFLESGRHFVINAEDDMDAAYTARAYAAWMYDDYLEDIEKINSHGCREPVIYD